MGCDSCGKKIKRSSTAAVVLLVYPKRWRAIMGFPGSFEFCDRACLKEWLEKHP